MRAAFYSWGRNCAQSVGVSACQEKKDGSGRGRAGLQKAWADGAIIGVARLPGLPAGRLTDFSYVWHLFNYKLRTLTSSPTSPS